MIIKQYCHHSPIHNNKKSPDLKKFNNKTPKVNSVPVLSGITSDKTNSQTINNQLKIQVINNNKRKQLTIVASKIQEDFITTGNNPDIKTTETKIKRKKTVMGKINRMTDIINSDRNLNKTFTSDIPGFPIKTENTTETTETTETITTTTTKTHSSNKVTETLTQRINEIETKRSNLMNRNTVKETVGNFSSLSSSSSSILSIKSGTINSIWSSLSASALSSINLLKTSLSSSISSSASATFKNLILTMNLYKKIAITILVILEVLLVVPVNAGPIDVKHHRMVREIYSELENSKPTVPLLNETSTSGQTQQDGTCLLDGIITKRATIHCETKPGCKAIQKTGYCCPEYQCECEKDGKLYSNNEKLPDQYQTDPCKVCFCKGGEIVCTNVSCYKRDDCEPKYIPGRCCPEYDNCPPLEIGQFTTSKTPQSPSAFIHNVAADSTLTIDDSLQKLDQIPSASTKHPTIVPQEMLHNPLNITIKEITKVEEIRITDAPPVNGNNNEGKINEEENVITPIVAATSATGNGAGEATNENTKLTLVETKTILFPTVDNSPYQTSINEIKSSPIYSTTESNKVLITDNNLLNGEESVKIVRHAEAPHSTGNENKLIQGNNHHNKQYTSNSGQIGEEVVIIDKNGNSKPITVFGIKGLQRGDVIDDPNSSSSSNRFDNDNKKHITKLTSSKEFDSNESGEYDPIQASSSNDFVRVSIPSSTENPLELGENINSTKAGEDEEVVFETLYYTEGPELSSSSSVSPPSINSDEVYEPVHYTPEPEYQSSSHSSISDMGELQLNETSEEKVYDPMFYPSAEVFETYYHELENDTLALPSSSTSSPETSSEHFPFDNEEESEVEVNPAYPKLEDDLSLHREINGAATDYLEGNTETKSLVSNSAGAQIKEEPRSSSDSFVLDNSEFLDFNFDSGSSSTTESQNKFNLENSFNENDTYFNDIFEPASSPEPRVPGEPCLIPEWERINGTHTSRCNQTYASDSSIEDYSSLGLTLLKGNDSGWPSSSEVDDFGSGMGSGFHSANLILDRKEPTTPKSKKENIDIDELDSSGSGSGKSTLANDPKDDAESLKLDEDDNAQSSGGSGVGINGAGIANEINKKTIKSFYGFDSFI